MNEIYTRDRVLMVILTPEENEHHKRKDEVGQNIERMIEFQKTRYPLAKLTEIRVWCDGHKGVDEYLLPGNFLDYCRSGGK